MQSAPTEVAGAGSARNRPDPALVEIDADIEGVLGMQRKIVGVVHDLVLPGRNNRQQQVRWVCRAQVQHVAPGIAGLLVTGKRQAGQAFVGNVTPLDHQAQAFLGGKRVDDGQISISTGTISPGRRRCSAVCG
jgi:hypothetical protein